MQTLRFINNLGREIKFNNSAPYVFWLIEGAELPPVFVVNTKAAGQNGYTLHSMALEERTVKITAHIHGKDGIRQMYRLRKELNAVCNPLLGPGRLIYENDNGSYEVKAFCKANTYSGKIHNLQTLTVSFECPSSFWQSVKPFEIKLAYVEGGLEFPIRTPGFFGKLGYKAVINNDGDVPAPLEFFIDGGAINPIIRNDTTGEFIKLTRQLQSYDKLYINTDPENYEVSHITINTETNEPQKMDAFGYITPDSSLFKLARGENVIKFTSDDENKKVKIVILYRKRYAGV